MTHIASRERWWEKALNPLSLVCEHGPKTLNMVFWCQGQAAMWNQWYSRKGLAVCIVMQNTAAVANLVTSCPACFCTLLIQALHTGIH